MPTDMTTMQLYLTEVHNMKEEGILKCACLEFFVRQTWSGLYIHMICNKNMCI